MCVLNFDNEVLVKPDLVIHTHDPAIPDGYIVVLSTAAKSEDADLITHILMRQAPSHWH